MLVLEGTAANQQVLEIARDFLAWTQDTGSYWVGLGPPSAEPVRGILTTHKSRDYQGLIQLKSLYFEVVQRGCDF